MFEAACLNIDTICNTDDFSFLFTGDCKRQLSVRWNWFATSRNDFFNLCGNFRGIFGKVGAEVNVLVANCIKERLQDILQMAIKVIYFWCSRSRGLFVFRSLSHRLSITQTAYEHHVGIVAKRS